MKKFSLILVALAVVSFVAFTSCDDKKKEGDDKDKKNDKEQVTDQDQEQPEVIEPEVVEPEVIEGEEVTEGETETEVAE